ncbi:MAG: efflux RND transporter periplasmic adaptor subunit [Opitutales bacterium]
MHPLRKTLYTSAVLAALTIAYVFAGPGHDHDGHGHDHSAAKPKTVGGHSHPHENDDDHGHPHDGHSHPHDDHGDHDPHDDHGAHGDHGDHGDEPEPVVVTQYTANSELFLEHPPLLRGEAARLIVHLTRLSDFSPITEGSLEVRLVPASGQPYTLIAERPARAGIFLPEIVPPFTGTATMELILRSTQMNTVHRIENVQVYATAEDVPHAHHEEASDDVITFLKEQQWRIDFATVPAEKGRVAPSVRAYGSLRLPASGRAILPAPADGIIHFATDTTALEIGQHFAQGAALFRITPDASWRAGLTNLREEYELAKLELDRMEKLYREEAVAGRRVEEATIKLRTLEQALERIGVDLSGSGWDDFQAAARAPIGGVLAEIQVLPGQRVSAGQALAVLENPSNMLLEAVVPVTRIENFRRASDAIFHLAHGETSYRVSELEGAAVSSVPLPAEQPGFARFLFTFKNKDSHLLSGTKVSVHLLGEASQPGVVIPVQALNEEQGQPLVYVHTEGETVEKRFPRLGASDGRQVLVLHGIQPGERVVTKGATAIRLSSLSTTEMGHGHAH